MQTPASINLNDINTMRIYDGSATINIVCGECFVAFSANDKNIVEVKQERQTHLCPECGAVNAFSLRIV